MYSDIEWLKMHREDCSDEFMTDETGFSDIAVRIYNALMYKHDYGKSNLAWQDIYDIAIKAAEEEILQNATDSWGDRMADWRYKDEDKKKARTELVCSDDYIDDSLNCDLVMDIKDTASNLGEDYTEVLRLRLQGYSFIEIAEMLGTSTKTVRRMLKLIKSGNI